MQISIKIIKVFCQAKLGERKPECSVLFQIREPITWISSRKCIMHHTLCRSFSIGMFSLSHHAFKRPHLIGQCKIHELFQCVISDTPARLVCLSKQFIESKQADFAWMALFSGQPRQHRWEILMLLYITLYRLSSSMTLMIASFSSYYIYQEHTGLKNVWSRTRSLPFRPVWWEQAARWQEAFLAGYTCMQRHTPM